MINTAETKLEKKRENRNRERRTRKKVKEITVGEGRNKKIVKSRKNENGYKTTGSKLIDKIRGKEAYLNHYFKKNENIIKVKNLYTKIYKDYIKWKNNRISQLGIILLL